MFLIKQTRTLLDRNN